MESAACRLKTLEDFSVKELIHSVEYFCSGLGPYDFMAKLALQRFIDHRRQNAPEFGVKVVDESAESLSEFTAQQALWIEGAARLARRNAEEMIRRKVASNTHIQAENRLTATDALVSQSKAVLDDHMRRVP